jgi:hypothetical protein
MLLVIFFIWKEMDLEAVIGAGTLVLYIIGFQLAGFNYIHYQSDGDKLKIQYYPVISFFGKEYSSIEFNKLRLFKAEIKRPFIFSNLHLEVKTKKGIAEFPSVSLAAMCKNDIRAIQNDLYDLAQ